MIRRVSLAFFAIVLGLAAIGCGGNGDKNKNRDLDRPAPVVLEKK